MNITRLVADCPFCGRPNDAHSTQHDRPPVDGALSICWKCRNVGIFVSDSFGRLSIRRPTPVEAEAIAYNPNVARARAALDQSSDPYEAVHRLATTDTDAGT